MAGPYRYETLFIKDTLFVSGEKGAAHIQETIDSRVEQGWELFECHPLTTALAWRWTVLIFRQPHE